MVVLENSDYERIAEEVVAGYFDGTPLNDGILKLAAESDLNPNQLRQIVWAVNTKTHLELFEKQAQDKNVEFPVADADYILRKLYNGGEDMPLPVSSGVDKIACDFYTPLELPIEKVAEADFVVEQPAVSEKTAAARRGAAIRTLRKSAAELANKVAMAREDYVQGTYALAWELRKLGYPEEFEKDAHAIYGDDVLPLLNDLRSVYKREALTVEKVASDFERVVDTNDKLFKKLAELRASFDEAIKCAKTLTFLNKRLEGLR